MGAGKRGSQWGRALLNDRQNARPRPLAGTTTSTWCPPAASRSAYVRIARTPPAMRRCGHRNVSFTPRSDGPRSARPEARENLGGDRLELRALVPGLADRDRKSTRLNSSHVRISHAVFCFKQKKTH